MDYRAALDAFAGTAGRPDEEIGLDEAAALIACMDNAEVSVEEQIALLDSLARGGARYVKQADAPLAVVNALSRYLFDDMGFKGNQEDYFDPKNSFLDQVLKRRLGIPITLALVYIEVGRRLGVPLLGIGMPGHFLVRHLVEEDHYIDPFHGGILLSVEECAQRFRQSTGDGAWNPSYLQPISNREYVARMLRNLKHIYLRQEDTERALQTMDWLVTLLPNAPEERRDRGLMYHRIGRAREALMDMEEFLAANPRTADVETIRQLVGLLRKRLGT